jgi:hypothetical protein
MLSLPSRSHPKKQNRAVYTKELTHLARMLRDIFLRPPPGHESFGSDAARCFSGCNQTIALTTLNAFSLHEDDPQHFKKR